MKRILIIPVICTLFLMALILTPFALLAKQADTKQQAEIAQLQTELEATQRELAQAINLIDTYQQHNEAIASLLGQAADTLETIAYGPYSRQEVQELITQVANILREINQTLQPGQIDEISQAIVTNAAAAGIDPMLLLSVAITESNCRPLARGGSGEFGMLQVMPGTGRWIAKRLGYSKTWEPADMLNIKQNIQFGSYYLRIVTREFGGNTSKGLLAYNRGSGGARTWLDSQAAGSHRYVSRVQKVYSRYGGPRR